MQSIIYFKESKLKNKRKLVHLQQSHVQKEQGCNTCHTNISLIPKTQKEKSGHSGTNLKSQPRGGGCLGLLGHPNLPGKSQANHRPCFKKPQWMAPEEQQLRLASGLCIHMQEYTQRPKMTPANVTFETNTGNSSE